MSLQLSPVIATGGEGLGIPVTPAQGGTGTTTVFTQGSVIFAGASGVYSQDNAKLFWDDTNFKLGIGTNTPLASLSVGGGSLIDATLPIQISTAGTTTEVNLGINKNGAYGFLLGYKNSNGTFGAYPNFTGGYMRQVTTDPFVIAVNNVTISTLWNSSGSVFFGGNISSSAGAGSFMTVLSTGFVGIGTNNPSAALSIAQIAASSGVPITLSIIPAANTGITLSTNAPQISVATSTQTWATGTVTEADYILFNAPTFAAAAASTFTVASTVTISAAPIQGTNATLTNAYALWVKSGITEIDGGAVFGSTASLATTQYYIGQVSSAFYFNAGGNFFQFAINNTVTLSSNNRGNWTFASTANSAGTNTVLKVTPGNNTGATASTNIPQFLLNSSTQTSAAGAVTEMDYAQFNIPTYAFASASTITLAATVTIAGAPLAGANATITAAYALYVAGGQLGVLGTSGNSLKFLNSIGAPSSGTPVLPTTVVGGQTSLLGGPTIWTLINIAGTDYKIPAY